MKRLNSIFEIFIFYILFYAFNKIIFESIANYDPFLLLTALKNLAEDFVKISFPVNLNISSELIVNIISFSTAFLVHQLCFKYYQELTLRNIFRILYTIFFIYTGILFSTLYLFRLFNLPRLYFLVAIIIFPILGFGVILILKKLSKINMNLKKIPPFVYISVVLIVFFFPIRTFLLSSLQPVEIETNLVKNLIDNDLSYDSLDDSAVNSETFELVCNPWKGSENFNSCVYGLDINKVELGKPFSNFISSRFGNLLLSRDGEIFSFKNNEVTTYLDLSSKVAEPSQGGEFGLYDLEFHPSENYFLVTYTSSDKRSLVLERYEVNNTGEPIVGSGENILTIPTNSGVHFSGSLLWSKYFNDFILTTGDMSKNFDPYSDPFNSLIPKGKALLVFSNYKTATPLLSYSSEYKPLRGIIGFGLRNPWQIHEYNDFLFIPDVGNAILEELNIIDLKKYTSNDVFQSISFGWPKFEGNLKNDDKPIDLFYWGDEGPLSADKFIEDTSFSPQVFYNHSPFDGLYRAAIIGGGVLNSPASYYHEHYFFTDYLTKELFSYDYKNNKLYLFPVVPDFGEVTSLNLDPENVNGLILTTIAGEIVKIEIPVIYFEG
tara:strand:- start:6140 stop:7951 length:1812 start_codon:yes stop_codon:yes gene_type:complete